MNIKLLFSNLYNVIEHFFHRKEVSSYDLLLRFNKIRNTSMADKQTAMSERAKLIIKILKEYGLYHEVQEIIRNECKMYNIVVPFVNAEKSGVVIHSVHHDVVNVNSLNVLDNTASVANVLALAINLRGKRLNHRTTFVFTDGEEIGGIGAKHIADEITLNRFGNVIAVIVHELTGAGYMWVDQIPNNVFFQFILAIINPHMFVHETPFNDVNIYRAESLPAICLGTMPTYETKILSTTGSCGYWRKCHKMDDDMGFANRKDMETYVEELKLFSL